jgi:hypothetical protein
LRTSTCRSCTQWGDKREKFGERDQNMNEAEQNGPLSEIIA